MRRPRLARGADGLLALAVAGAVGLLVFPLPPPLLDWLLSAQLALSVVMVLVALGARRPLDLSGFSTLLLLTTLFRLTLNVSTTRLILSRGDAGRVVAAFGDAVVAGNLLVGAVVFAVLTLVQYLVIARGAERVAEVAARFALDGLPGRQLAIDADVRAGLLDPESARAQRAVLARESSLYGAMDGAMKFVRGDAIAGLCIVAINVIGGLVVGVGQRGLDVEQAVQVYTVLTVGDGLVTQLPAVLSAAAAALLATRVASPDDGHPAAALALQLAGGGRPLLVAGGLFAVLAALPGLPALPLGGVALGLLVLGRLSLRPRPLTPEAGPAPEVRPPAPVGLVLHPDAVRALAPATPDDVIDRARIGLAARFGVALPAVRVEPDARDMPPGEYRIEIGEAPVARGQLPAGKVFVCPAPEDEAGLEARDPDNSAPGRWVPSGPGLRAAEYLEAHLAAVWRRFPAALGVQAVADRMAALEASQPALVRATVPRRLALPRLTRLLRRLLAEDVPVRDLAAVLEQLADGPDTLTDEDAEFAALRQGLAPLITRRVAPDGRLDALMLSVDLEAALRRPTGPTPAETDAMLDQLDGHLAAHPRVALLVPGDLRAACRALLVAELPGLPVICAEELLPGTTTHPRGFLAAE